MNLYKLHSNSLNSLKEKPFKLEKEIQQVFETNLSELMDLQLVKSEFSIKNKRIDTLAYDPQSKAFIIIEYKRNKNISVVDQGFTYLSLMLENKADFIVEYNETLKTNLKRSEVDWSQTRVVFVSTGFTENQKTATNFKDIAIELWEIKRYENNLISVNQIKKSKAAESIKPITSSNSKLESVTKEIKVYTEEDHLANKSDQIVELYEAFKEAMRIFVGEMTPEDYTNAEDIKNYFGNMMDAVIELSNDPKYQKLGIDPNNLLSHTAAPTPTEIEKKTLRRNRD